MNTYFTYLTYLKACNELALFILILINDGYAFISLFCNSGMQIKPCQKQGNQYSAVLHLKKISKYRLDLL